eukprot:m.89326 g.89326  ORF g.89326 m.89326 type:complete len:86 (+) comp12891_c0_seq1:246-503(+)
MEHILCIPRIDEVRRGSGEQVLHIFEEKKENKEKRRKKKKSKYQPNGINPYTLYENECGCLVQHMLSPDCLLLLSATHPHYHMCT